MPIFQTSADYSVDDRYLFVYLRILHTYVHTYIDRNMVSVCFQKPLRRVGSRVNRVMLTAAAHRIASRGSYENHNKAGGARERDDSREWVGKEKKKRCMHDVDRSFESLRSNSPLGRQGQCTLHFA